MGAATLISWALYDFAHLKRLAGVFLLSILIAAIWSGARAALFASLLAFIAYAYFIVEPRFSLQIDTYQEAVNLLAFIVVAIVTGQLAGRLREEIDRTHARALRLTVLFEASRELSAIAQDHDIRQCLASELSKAAQGRAEVIWEGKTWAADSDAGG